MVVDQQGMNEVKEQLYNPLKNLILGGVYQVIIWFITVHAVDIMQVLSIWHGCTKARNLLISSLHGLF